MKNLKSYLTVIIILASHSIFAQQSKINWDKWNFLIGEWVGEGNGQPGQGSGSFTFQTDLDGKILVRKNHTEFPATADRPAATHNDLLYIYPDFTGVAAKAIYFDNEGHVINYAITYSEGSIVFTSDIIPNAPRFRLTYTSLGNDAVNIKFEFAQPQKPDEFKVYIEGKSIRKK
jgi:hypothetical protein